MLPFATVVFIVREARSALRHTWNNGKEDDMPKDIDRDEVQRLANSGARIIDVLPKADYEQFHLPGAISIQLEKIDAASTGHLPKDQPLITYCQDTQ